MSISYIKLEGIGQVKLYRRKGLKNIRISINSAGEVRLSMPWYVPKGRGLKYLHSKKDWIKKNQKNTVAQWTDGQMLTGNHKLRLLKHVDKNVKSYTDKDSLNICLPEGMHESDRHQSIKSHVDKFLKKECEKTLIPHVLQIAEKSGYNVKAIRIKKLKSRWGSCNQDKVITFNQSLITLPVELSEYVVFHELAHTKHLNHSKEFWREVETFVPDYKLHRKTLRTLNTNGIL